MDFSLHRLNYLLKGVDSSKHFQNEYTAVYTNPKRENIFALFGVHKRVDDMKGDNQLSESLKTFFKSLEREGKLLTTEVKQLVVPSVEF